MMSRRDLPGDFDLEQRKFMKEGVILRKLNEK